MLRRVSFATPAASAAPAAAPAAIPAATRADTGAASPAAPANSVRFKEGAFAADSMPVAVEFTVENGVATNAVGGPASVFSYKLVEARGKASTCSA